jgi:hypothetical protein
MGIDASDLVARKEWICIFHTKHGAGAQYFNAELTLRCDGTYGRNREVATFDLPESISQ